jgi:bifunctional DNA-binding transcriptional regulator/antitoxin component of YhaV-PrlF toxin-antitoxin module
VTIPQEIRRKYGIDKETEVRFEEDDGRVYLVMETPPSSAYRQAAGAADAGMTTEEILSLTRGKDA